MENKYKVSDKVMSIRVPEPLFSKFKDICDANFKSMSDTIRDFIRDQIKQERQ
jgi:metal-responsive CopG/Arc/MetJ family transcriptional regulator